MLASENWPLVPFCFVFWHPNSFGHLWGGWVCFLSSEHVPTCMDTAAQPVPHISINPHKHPFLHRLLTVAFLLSFMECLCASRFPMSPSVFFINRNNNLPTFYSSPGKVASWKNPADVPCSGSWENVPFCSHSELFFNVFLAWLENHVRSWGIKAQLTELLSIQLALFW